MSAYELLYAQRQAYEAMIQACDDILKCQPNDREIIRLRRLYARVAFRFHAKIERIERTYDV